MRNATLVALFGAGFLGLFGCVEPAPSRDTVEICDSSGCSERSTDSATFDPSQAVPNPDPEGRLPALVAAAEADPRAAFDLGIRYMRGDGIAQNSWQALEWMRNAGERGDLRAQKALGRLYLTGLEEMGADYNEAQRWLSMAAARGDKESAKLLKDAEAGRANEQAFQTSLVRWRQLYTHPYWYRSRYYGYWDPGYPYYRYY